LRVRRGPGELEDNFSIPVQSQPCQAVDDRVDRGGGRSLAVRIFDPQKHLAAMPLGVEPIEQGRPAAADVKKTCRGGGKSGDNFAGHIRVRLNPRLCSVCCAASVYHNFRSRTLNFMSATTKSS